MATGEILRAISSSPTDVQPVFVAIAEERGPAVRGRGLATVTRASTASGFTWGRSTARSTRASKRATTRFPDAAERAGGAARAFVTRDIVHIPDVFADEEYAIQNTRR